MACAEVQGGEALSVRQIKKEARGVVNHGFKWLRTALAPIIHLIAQKLLGAQGTVAAAEALADAAVDDDGTEDPDDMVDCMSPPGRRPQHSRELSAGLRDGGAGGALASCGGGGIRGRVIQRARG